MTRLFTILGDGGEKIGEQTADFLTFADAGIVQFVALTDAGEDERIEDVIAVCRTWTTITSEPLVYDAPDPEVMMAEMRAAVAEVSGVHPISKGTPERTAGDDTDELVARALAAQDEPIETGVVDDAPPAPVKTAAEKAKVVDLVEALETSVAAAKQERKTAEAAGPSVAEAEAAARARALALQTSGPDAPGAEEDPTPDPGQGDTDANPPAPPAAESTGDDHPPAAAGEADGGSTLRVALSTYMAHHPELNEKYVEWLWSEQIPTSITKATTAQLERAVAWWGEQTREGDDG